jgi:hypothetical protein
MGDSSAGKEEGLRRSTRDWLSGGVVGFAGGVGLCAGLGILLAVHAWKKHEPDRVETRAHRAAASVPVSAADVVLAAEPGSSAPSGTKPEKKPVETAPARELALAGGIADAPEKSKAAAIERSPGARALASATVRNVSPETDPFKLSPPPVSVPAPFVLPEKPWFAVAELTSDETESCQGTQAVCAANRSLNTALAWAKSPAEAAEQAKRDGKLVFLIHVSGNFEDPGFT